MKRRLRRIGKWYGDHGSTIAGIGIIIVSALAAWGYTHNTERINRDEQQTIDANGRAIAAGHQQTLAACRAGNLQLRQVINQRIVRPLHDTLYHAANGGSIDPTFYHRVLGEVATVPYTRCHHRYPPIGTQPHPPYFRAAPLPKPLRASSSPPPNASSASPPGASQPAISAGTTPTPGTSVPSGGGGATSPPPTSPFGGGSGGGGSGGSGGGSGQPPPPTPPPPPPKPPPPPPTPQPRCTVNLAGIRICLPPISL